MENQKEKRVKPEAEKLKFVSFRVCEKDYREIKKQADELNKSVSEFCRQLALKKNIVVFEFTEDSKNQLRSISQNLNLLQIDINRGNAPSDEKLIFEIEQSLGFIKKMRKEFRNGCKL